jgi:serine/threonine-protein kinase
VIDLGEVFAVFDRQDSGNVSFGVRIDGLPYFVKTAGPVDESHAQRVARLRTAIEIAAVAHPTMPALRRVIESPAGPQLVYDWFDGELLGARRELRDDPASAFQRFRALPAERTAACLDAVFDLHVALASAGWIAGDFYDGCLMYEFSSGELRVIDLDHYHRGPLTNTLGRMFGSSRFMAPEECERGAVIDERTTVFNLGRAIHVFLGEREVAVRACEPEPARRFATVTDFVAAWRR